VPLERGDFIIELRKAGPMEFGTTSSGSKIGSDFERLQWGESFNTCFLEGMLPNRLVELSIAAVGTIDGMEWN